MSEVIEKKYNCPICSKTFTKPHTVKVHMRLHTGHRPHECQLCPKTFVTSSALKDHLVSHVNSRNCLCNKCGAKFKHKGTLKRHQAQHDEYEKRRDHQENIETAVVYDPHIPYDQSVTKYFITAEEAQEKFPQLQEFFGQESQELKTHAVISNVGCHATVVKQEKILEEEEEVPYDAAVLELTENNVYDEEGINVRVYNVSEEVQDHISDPLPSTGAMSHSLAKPLFRPRVPGSPKTPSITQSSELASPAPDITVGYGSHVSRILRLLDSQEKQAALIKKLNKTIHSFIITYRK